MSKIPERLAANFLQFSFGKKTFGENGSYFDLLCSLLSLPFHNLCLVSKKGLSLEKNSEVVIAMDVSNSMNTKDIDPNLSRLDIAKRAAVQLINGLQGERLGVLIFAGSAYVQLPITKDYNAAKLFINEIDTKMLSNQGTNFCRCIGKSKKACFQKEMPGNVF